MNVKYNNCTKEWIVVTDMGVHVPFQTIEDAEEFLDHAEGPHVPDPSNWKIENAFCVTDTDGLRHIFDSQEDRRQWLHWYKNELKTTWKINADPPERTDAVEGSISSRWVCFSTNEVLNGQCAPYYPTGSATPI